MQVATRRRLVKAKGGLDPFFFELISSTGACVRSSRRFASSTRSR